MSLLNMVKAFVERINARDINGLTALMTDTHRFIDALGNVVTGHQRLHAAWVGYFGLIPDYCITAEEWLYDGVVVVLCGKASGSYRGQRWETPVACRVLNQYTRHWYTARSGNECTLAFCHVAWTDDGCYDFVRGEPVAEWRVCSDNEPWRQLMNAKNFMKAKRLAPTRMVTAFENGYWYTVELKEFALSLGILSAGKLRKDELEKAILVFLKIGQRKNPARRCLTKSGVKDVERGLSLKLPVVKYTNDKATKDFHEREACKLAPQMKRKSGALPVQSLARRPTYARQRDYLRRFGQAVRRVEGNRGAFRTGSARQVHQFCQRLSGGGAGRDERARHRRVERAQNTGGAEDLPSVGATSWQSF